MVKGKIDLGVRASQALYSIYGGWESVVHNQRDTV